jgi:hypothetical protein
VPTMDRCCALGFAFLALPKEKKKKCLLYNNW